MSLTHEDVIRYLESLSGEELSKLADEVLARVGAPPIAAPLPPEPVSTMGVPWPPEMGYPAFEVVLRDYGADKLAVIVALRRALGPDLGLDAAKKLVESAPVVVREAVDRREADAIAEELRRAGAVVDLR